MSKPKQYIEPASFGGGKWDASPEAKAKSAAATKKFLAEIEAKKKLGTAQEKRIDK